MPNIIDAMANAHDRQRRNWQRAAKGAIQKVLQVTFPLVNSVTGLSLSINPAGGLSTATNGLGLLLTGTNTALTLSTNGLSVSYDGSTIQVNGSGQLYAVTQTPTLAPAGGLQSTTNGLSISLSSSSGLILSTNGLSFNPTSAGGLQNTTNGAGILLASGSQLTLSTNGLGISTNLANLAATNLQPFNGPVSFGTNNLVLGTQTVQLTSLTFPLASGTYTFLTYP